MSDSSEWRERVQRLKERPRNDDEPSDDQLEIFDQLVVTSVVSGRAGFEKWLAQMNGGRWVYRGQSRACRYLQPSLEWNLRHGLNGCLGKDGDPVEGDYMPPAMARIRVEQWLLSLFEPLAKHCKELRAALPEREDALGWMSLMQHYGAPTRLLDWSWCPDVALYFALTTSKKCESDKCCAVWAIDGAWIEEASHQLMSSDPRFPLRGDRRGVGRYLNRVLREPKQSSYAEPCAVVLAEPLCVNENMVAQHGLFLCSLEIGLLMYQVLAKMVFHAELPAEPPIRKVVLAGANRSALLAELKEQKNIDGRSLFPGLPAFGQRLAERLKKKLRQKAERELGAIGFEGDIFIGEEAPCQVVDRVCDLNASSACHLRGR